MSDRRNETGPGTGLPDGPLLAIDTSTASMTMALTDGETVLAERTTNAERNHSVKLLPEIDELVRTAGLRPRDVRAVAVGCGPGSYTGVRIGVTMAKTFAWALGLPVYAVSSLEALAFGGWRDAAAGTTAVRAPAWVVPALDARRGQAYTALFAADADDAAVGAAGAWRRVGADAVTMFREQAEAWLRAAERPGTVVFVGEVDGGFADMLDAAAAGLNAIVLRRPWSMSALDVASIARLRGEAIRVRDPHDALPNYAQLAEAEAKLVAASAAEAREKARERN
ncbi:tRNA (adenosine(37)-N6)-threonylcarbamoyltransferase complex dimerization subunit type 1 TsaB [Paenibacillus sp.]|uniref:tRNA (adenosine(37)-N6)-threonylcarbamoyltransferase complex dimerization subunit type 1 TsaB n=1 Tax=Paenibacillus sp. TaxID=58172 RepID=UPI002812897D|nr:tRNA (adenosine(37)-N6)-threonylcarbamoyltransferase complex dimerization subunit type 1 TsaB [Paenibacillus sp.]